MDENLELKSNSDGTISVYDHGWEKPLWIGKMKLCRGYWETTPKTHPAKTKEEAAGALSDRLRSNRMRRRGSR